MRVCKREANAKSYRSGSNQAKPDDANSFEGRAGALWAIVHSKKLTQGVYWLNGDLNQPRSRTVRSPSVSQSPRPGSRSALRAFAAKAAIYPQRKVAGSASGLNSQGRLFRTVAGDGSRPVADSQTQTYGRSMIDGDPFGGRLLPGERTLWSGRPATGVLFTPKDAFLIPFSALWCGFVIFWIGGVLVSGGGAFALFGVVFLCFGLFFSVGRFILDAALRRNTRYALTDRRVLILRTGPLSSFTAVALDRLPEAQISERATGTGTIRFGQQQSLFGFGQSGLSIWTPSLDPTPQFLAIPEARRVFDLVQTAVARGH